MGLKEADLLLPQWLTSLCPK